MQSVDRHARANLLLVHRLLAHIDDREIPRFPIVAIDGHANVDLRVKWLLGEISESLFARLLQQREKAHQKRREIGEVMRTTLNVSDEMLREFVIDGARMRDNPEVEYDVITAEELLNKLKCLFSHADIALAELGIRYSCVVPRIDVEKFVIASGASAQLTQQRGVLRA